MKKTLHFTLPLLLLGCSTAHLNQTRTITDPLVVAAVSAYASEYGVPPALTNTFVVPLQNQFWGMLAQANAKQPIAQGADIPAVGSAVAKAVASDNSGQPTTALLLNAISTLKK